MNQSQFSLHLLSRMKMQEQSSIIKKISRIQDNIKIAIGVWNMQGIIPPSNSIKVFMESMLDDEPDLICISTQECQRSINMSYFCENKDQWENCIKESARGYSMVESETMSAMHIAILVRQDISNCFTVQNRVKMRAGVCNLFGNKGAISLEFNLLGQSFQFINCHLQAHQDQCPRRNEVLLRIVNQLVNKDYRAQIFICGDLNYRIDMTHQQYYELVKGKVNTEKIMQYSKMREKDQIYLQQQLKDRFFPYFKEEPITFPPTYKIHDDNQEYDKKRIPGWTDRIFHRKGRARQLSYRCLYDLYGTDHRPVLATFQVETEETLSIFPEDFIPVKTRDSCALI